ncbi:hypothetical protein HII27_22665 [Kluyvera sp. SCKS090646]|uniref:Ead/Ea22-like family protein n=1 Tax=Kluyvera sichuanensis TaxID=2725494 RepID=A0ABR6RZJ4_9ENTR|nr:hypothetical protein [Kluyvera sichuanensis]MBC1188496.1 hypothetical protein [Kluyvera sichuanensis]
MSIIELTRKKMAIEAELAQLKAKFTDDTSRIGKELIAVSEGINQANKGLSVEMVQHGMTIISFGDPKQSTERRRCVEDAINDIASGFPRLSERYFGTKNYAHWSDQREDHRYGYGPGHGSICFKVGLTVAALAKLVTGGLSDYDAECAIYCLMNIDAINAANAKAREAS